MAADPFESWYTGQIDIDIEKHFKSGDWNFFTIDYDADSPFAVDAPQISRADAEEWADQISRGPTRVPGVNLLIAQHKELGNRDMEFRDLPFHPREFKSIFEKLHLPKQYFHLRSTGGAQSGAATYHTECDASGKVSRITFVIRPAHSSLTVYGASYRFALSWNAVTMRTIGYIENLTQADITHLAGYIKSSAHILFHPLTLPEIFLHEIMIHLNERIRIPIETEFYEEERRTGLSRVNPAQDHNAIWKWGFVAFQESTRTTNRFITALAYLRRRYAFAIHLTRRFLTIMDALQTYEYTNPETKAALEIREHERRERLQNRLALLENYEHQTECVSKRAENLITVLYTVLSQIDSRNQGHLARINLQIAQAVRSDSIPVRTIAYVTLVLLPGAFISSIFGMNYFSFNDETRSIVVAESFWQYWAITIPVTICIVLIWNIWVWWEKRDNTSTIDRVPKRNPGVLQESRIENGHIIGDRYLRQSLGTSHMSATDLPHRTAGLRISEESVALPVDTASTGIPQHSSMAGVEAAFRMELPR